MNNRIMKQIAVTMVTSSLFISAYAVSPGFYLGISTGPATNTGGTQYVQTMNGGLTAATPKSSQWGTQIVIGNKLNNYASIQGGLVYFTGVQYDTKEVATCSSTQVRIRGFDVVAKGEMSLGPVEGYVKAGPSILYQTLSGDMNADLSQPCGKSSYTTKFRPTFGLGASYDMTQNWVVDFSYTTWLTGGPAGNATIYGLGISYHFVNVYCGQFLCDGT